MVYELRKSFCNKVVIMMLLIFIVINGLEASYLSPYVTREDDEYTTEDYERLMDEAFASIDEGRDVRLSSIFIEKFVDREFVSYTYETMEAAFVDYDKYAVYGMVLIIIITVMSIDIERRSRMNQIISVTEKRTTRVVLAKQLSIVITAVIINALFVIQNIIVHSLVGDIDYNMKLYNIPGYRSTLFDGSILEYKLICAWGICLAQIIVANIIYMVACICRKNASLIIGGIIAYGVLNYCSDRIAFKHYPIKLFSFFESKYLVNSGLVVFIGDSYMQYIWLAVIFLIFTALVVNIGNFLMYRVRRSV